MPNMVIAANEVLGGYFIPFTKQSNFRLVKVAKRILNVFSFFPKYLSTLCGRNRILELGEGVLCKPKELTVGYRHRKHFRCDHGAKSNIL